MQSHSTALAAVVLFSLPASAGTHLLGNGKALHWKDGKVTLRVSRAVHLDGGEGFGVDRREAAAATHAAVYEAIRSWQRAGVAGIEVDLALTDAQTVSAGENVVTFTDPAPFDTGLCDKERFISCTMVSFTENGEIVGASVAFNPYKRHSSVGLAGTHDLGLIMRHEMGHVLGLDHSFASGSVMLAEAELEPAEGAPVLFAARKLSEDDLATLALRYPEQAVMARVSGAVKRADGSPAVGARVVAIDAVGRVCFGAVAGAGGRYELALRPGKGYRFVAESDDEGAASASSQGLDLAGSNAEATDVDITLMSADRGKAAVDSVGLVAGGFYAGLPRVDVARGHAYPFALTRSPAALAVTFQFPEPAIAAQGQPSSPVSAPQLVRQTIQVNASAAPGDYAVFVHSAGGGASLLPGLVRVVTSPAIRSVEDADTGEPVLGFNPGRRYRIRGDDLAISEARAVPEFDGAPFPAQLNGMSVRMAGRFMPLVSVAPREVVFEVPVRTAGLKPGLETELVVSSGTAMNSQAFPVRILELAPRSSVHASLK